jgi:transcriptional regulator with XRE-family HTH domain
MKKEHSKIGMIIKAEMDKKGVTQASLGESLGITRQAVAKMLTSKTIDLARVNELSELLDFSMHKSLLDLCELKQKMVEKQ